MVFIMELIDDEIVDFLDVKYIARPLIGYTLQPSIYEISDNNLELKSSLPNEVKVKSTIDDIRLRSRLFTKKKLSFTEECSSIHY